VADRRGRMAELFHGIKSPRHFWKAPPAGSRVSGANSLSHEAIAQRAYELFLHRGHAHGHALEDWLQAERELREELSKPVVKRLRGSSRRSPTKL